MSFLDNIKNPPREFSPAAFWFWYGTLLPDQLRMQIRMMVEQGVYNGFMHARAYLKTPYLGDEWWNAVDACIDEGNKVGFYPWIYDEYAWPSGTAGSTFDYGYQEPSRTLAKGPINMSKSLKPKRFHSWDAFAEAAHQPQKNTSLMCAFYQDGDVWKPLGVDFEEKPSWEPGRDILAFFQCIHTKFVDYLDEKPTREFIEHTHEQYKARFSEFFGNRIPGVFFDEIFMINNMPWTWRFPEEFKKRCGYDLMPLLYALAVEGGSRERRIRLDYFRVVAELYEESFFKQISSWCCANHLEFTGHIEEWLSTHPGRQGHFFNNMRHLSIPGADCHDYRYRFPRKITYREPKFSVSVARAYGKKRAMSEALGGAGWGCSLQQFKRGINTLGAMGTNMIVLHGFHSECDSQGTQADWPNSFFFQNPYWRYFKYFAEYIHRICYMNTQGSPVVDVGLYYPIEEMQMETVAGGPTKAGVRLDQAFNTVMNVLIENQIDVDMIDNQSFLRAEVTDGRIRVGDQAFRVLLFPEVLNVSANLQRKLNRFIQNGGFVLYYACSEKQPTDGVAPHDLPDVLRSCFQPDVEVVRGTKNNLYINHRKAEDKDVYFVANSSPYPRAMTINLRAQGEVKRLNPENAELSPVTYLASDRGTQVDLSLEPDEACWLILDKHGQNQQFQSLDVVEELSVPGTWEFLPILPQITGKKQLTTQSTRIKIPLAAFSSLLHPDGRQIRIQNKEGEMGCCGRHLSLWQASWITRRPDWFDDAQKNMLCFRRRFSLESDPSAARLCIAAVNEWSLWINGTYVAECDSGRTPSDLDISAYLHAGENLIAIQVRNRTPMGHFNLLSVENLPEHELISLLAQAHVVVNGETQIIGTDREWEVIDRVLADWEKPYFTTDPIKRDASSYISLGEGASTNAWLFAWERGAPPLLPWGDIPLFGETVSYPQRLCYSIVLPAGTSLISYPNLTGDQVYITVDGMERPWSGNVCSLKPDGLSHQLQITMTVNGAEEGLHEPIQITVTPFRTALGDWRLHGLKWYSGFVRYKNKLHLMKKSGRYFLSFGKVAHQAEVWINGKLAGIRIWEPYRLDVTEYLQNGENEITVIVSNSAAVERQFMLVDEGQALGWNRYWNYDNIQREGENLVSGLLGVVQLFHTL